jgi:hypothetical protein
MKHKVESTSPALFAGLEKLLAVLDPIENDDLSEVRGLVKRVLPNRFDSGWARPRWDNDFGLGAGRDEAL